VPQRSESPTMPAPRVAEARLFEIGRSDRYTGAVAVARLVAARDDSFRVYEVRFEAAARTVWHAHAGEQWLVGLVNVSVVQCAGEAVRRLRPGQSTLIPAGVRHWHGAGHASGASHLVLNVVGATTWEAPVGTDEYAAALSHS
jgi:quercetin dioxygenase-like cupin family protein